MVQKGKIKYIKKGIITAMKNPTEKIWNRNFTCVFIAYFLSSLASMSVNPLVSTYAKYLDAGPVLIGMMTGLIYGVAVVVRPITGPMAARIDNRKLMIFIGVLGVVIYLGYAFLDSIAAFTVLRVINGFQHGLIGSVFLAVASDSLPPSKLGAGISIYTLSFVAAQAFGPTIGTSLRSYGISLGSEALGYRLTFIAAAVFVAISLIPSFIIRLDKKTKDERESTEAWYKNIIAVRALPAAIMLMLTAFSFCLYTSYIVPYGFSMGISNISLFFTVTSIIGVCVRPVYGRLGDRFGLRVTLMPGFLLLAASLLIVSFARTLPVMLIGAVTASLGWGAVFPGLQAMGIQAVYRQNRGAASNTIICGQDMGFFLSPLLGGIVYSVSDYPTMYQAGMVPCVIAAIILLSVWPSFKRWKKDAQPTASPVESKSEMG